MFGSTIISKLKLFCCLAAALELWIPVMLLYHHSFISNNTRHSFIIKTFSFQPTYADVDKPKHSLTISKWHLTIALIFFCLVFVLFLNSCKQINPYPRSDSFCYRILHHILVLSSSISLNQPFSTFGMHSMCASIQLVSSFLILETEDKTAPILHIEGVPSSFSRCIVKRISWTHVNS